MDEAVKHIRNPELYLLRSQERGKALDGRLPPTDCLHPMNAIYQFVDEEPGRAGRPTNLFQCSVCNHLLRLVDFHGKEALDA